MSAEKVEQVEERVESEGDVVEGFEVAAVAARTQRFLRLLYLKCRTCVLYVYMYIPYMYIHTDACFVDGRRCTVLCLLSYFDVGVMLIAVSRCDNQNELIGLRQSEDLRTCA